LRGSRAAKSGNGSKDVTITEGAGRRRWEEPGAAAMVKEDAV
jgi:hypothetical protein